MAETKPFFEKPTLSLGNIVRLLSSDQRKVLLSKLQSAGRTKCPDCKTRDWKFGFVYLAGQKDQVTGITIECQKCGAAWATYFEPIDSLLLKTTKIKERGIVDTESDI